MNKDEVFKELLLLIKEVFPKFNDSEVNYETKIFSDLKLDSISLIYLAVLIEKRFNYKLTNKDINPTITINDLIEGIINK